VQSPDAGAWWAKGLLFENCSCQLVCPGHLHFEQLCTRDRCRGYWAIRVDDGRFGSVSLEGLRALIAFDSPKRMIDGGWTEIVIIDAAAGQDERQALETILTGRAGGPWALLAQFVGTRLPTRFLTIEFADEGKTKRAVVPSIMTAEVTDIRGRNRAEPVRFENIFNQIHAPSQVLALGTTDYDDGVIAFRNERTHGLHSRFDWVVNG
jgi:hypothetical protein